MDPNPSRALARPAEADATLLTLLFAAAVSLTVWIPVPLLDTVVETWLRRQLFRRLARRHGHELPDAALAALADPASSGCTGCLVAALWWPVKKLFKVVLAFLQFKDMADLVADVTHRGLLFEEALERGWLEDPVKVRQAMDRAAAAVRVKPLERLAFGVFLRQDPAWIEQIRTLTARERRSFAEGHGSIASRTLDRYPGLLPEIVQAFRLEMVAQLPEQGLAGPIVPEVMPPERPVGVEKRLEEPPPEDADEVKPHEP